MDPFKGWAVLELMGHRRLAGYVQEVQIAGAGMLRIDVPSADGEATQFVSPSSLYALTPCTEATARVIAKGSSPAPVNEYEFPSLRGKALPPGDDDLDEEDESPRETLDRLLADEGLDTILRGLCELHVDTAEPDADRVFAILEQARLLAQRDGAWPEQFGAGPGVEAIAKERDNQIAQYSADHDDAIEGDGQLAAAAAWILYSANSDGYSISKTPNWAHGFTNKNPGDKCKLLSTAGALIAAEIDRLKRAEFKAPPIEAQAADLTSAHPGGVDIPATPSPAPAPITIEDEVHF